jgi:hypothetical protein
MPPVTPGAHCAATGCDHADAPVRREPASAPRLHGRRVRSGRHTRTAATAATGRRSA